MAKKLFLYALLLSLASCGSIGEGSIESPGDSIAKAADPVVSRHGDGSWYTYTIEQGPMGSRIYIYWYSVWVDAKVQNLAYNKNFGLIWTVNGWTNNSVSYGSYKGDLGGGFEKWGLDVGKFDGRTVRQFEYCIFVEMNGVKYYDNNGGSNYTIRFW